MNNEDKILEILQSMDIKVNKLSEDFVVLDTKVDKLSEDFVVLDTKVDKLSEDLVVLDTKVVKLSDDVSNIQLHLENVTDRNIGLLMEQYNPNAEKLDKVVDKVDEMEFDIKVLKKVVISHSKDINTLMNR